MSDRNFRTRAVPDTRPRAAALNVGEQSLWHTTMNDQHRNFYRTSYQDQIMGREVCVKSVKPEGYGGYDVYKGANELFRNTEFARMQEVINSDGTRYRLPDFARQKEGIPDFTESPAGKSAQKTAKTIPSGFVVPPFAVDQYAVVLNFRTHVDVLQPHAYHHPAATAVPTPRSVPQPAGAAEAQAPSKPALQRDALDGAAVAASLPAATSLSKAATYVLNNGTRSPRKGDTPRRGPAQLFP